MGDKGGRRGQKSQKIGDIFYRQPLKQKQPVKRIEYYPSINEFSLSSTQVCFACCLDIIKRYCCECGRFNVISFIWHAMCAFQGNKTHQHDDTTLNIGEKIFREINAISRKFSLNGFHKKFREIDFKKPKNLGFLGNPGYPQNPGFFRYPIHHNFGNVI